MPPRYAYWTILVDKLPTAFRAATRDELLPTFERLRSKHPDTVMRWFARGRVWDSPEHATREERAPKQHRDKGWRPGGNHRDPRERFEQERKAKNAARRQERFERKTRDRRDGERAGAPPGHRDAPPPRSRDDRPRESRTPDAGRRRNAPTGPRGHHPGEDRGRPGQPWRGGGGGANRPPGPRGRHDQRFGSERSQRPPAGRLRYGDDTRRPGGDRDTRGARGHGPQARGGERPRHDRPSGDRDKSPRDRDRPDRPTRNDRFGARPRDERGGADRDGRRRDEGSRRGAAARPRTPPLETRRGQAEPPPAIPPGPGRPPRPGQEPPPLPARSEEIVMPPAPPERGRSIDGPEGTRLIKRRGGEPR